MNTDQKLLELQWNLKKEVFFAEINKSNMHKIFQKLQLLKYYHAFI